MTRLIAIAIAVVAGGQAASAQSDVQAWSSAGLERELTKRLDLGAEQHLRVGGDLSELDSLLTDVDLTLRVARWLRFGGGYRFGYRRTGSGDFAVRHRFHGELSLRRRLGWVRLDLRSRWQETLRGATANDGVRHKWRNRLRGRLRATDDTRPFASFELHHRIGDGEGFALDALRFTTGVSHALEATELEAFYRVEIPQLDPADPTLHIIGLGVSASI